MARAAYGMAIASGNVSAEIIDWGQFRQVSRELRVGAVPKTFVNYGDPIAGVIPEASLLERVVKGQQAPPQGRE